MELISVSRQQLASLDKTGQILAAGGCLRDIDSSRARKLLNSFRRGHWRKKVSATAQALAA